MFLDLKIARDDSGLYRTNGDFGPTRLSIKTRVFPLHVQSCERKGRKKRVIFSKRTLLVGALVRLVVKKNSEGNGMGNF